MPSTSSALVYGRAALLGVASGEHSCHTAYPRCPRNEDDILYYLNNHRGGFFRFFNGGAAFGDDTNYQINPNPYTQQQQQPQYQQQAAPQYQQLQQQQQQQQTQSTLSALQNVADLINQSGGINLSNLGSNADVLGNLASLLGTGGGSNGGSSSNSGSNSIDLNTLASAGSSLLSALGGGGSGTGSGSSSSSQSSLGNVNDLVGNLLTGFIGSRFSGRKLSKRSVDNRNAPDAEPADHTNKEFYRKSNGKKTEHNLHEKDGHTKGKKQNTKFVSLLDEFNVNHNNDTLIDADVPLDSDVSIGGNEAEARILNTKSHITADDGDTRNQIRFESNRDGKEFIFSNGQRRPTATNGDYSLSALVSFGTRDPKTIHFKDNTEYVSPQRPSSSFFPPTNAPARIRDSLTQTSVKMVFPEGDRTGTGNLKFDENAFQQPNDEFLHRLGRILTGIREQLASQTTTEAPFYVHNYNSNNNNNRYSSQSSPNRYQQPLYNNNQNYDYNYNQNDNRYGNYNNNNNRYGSNSYQSSAQYPYRGGSSGISPTNQNIYVTNGQGQTEYYIKPDGQKVRL